MSGDGRTGMSGHADRDDLVPRRLQSPCDLQRIVAPAGDHADALGGASGRPSIIKERGRFHHGCILHFARLIEVEGR